MAEQKGVLRYSGKLANTVGYARGKKHFSRAKPEKYTLSEESEKSSMEFGAGSTASKLVKKAIGKFLLPAFTTNLYNRLASRLREIIRTGPIAKKGSRGVFDGNIALLKDFEFNVVKPFSDIADFKVLFSMTSQEAEIGIAPFTWKEQIKAPKHTVDTCIGLCFAFVDFNNKVSETITAKQLTIAENGVFNGGRFRISIPQMEEMAVLVMLSIHFHCYVDKEIFFLNNKQYQAGTLLEALHIKDGKLVEFIAEESPEESQSESEESGDGDWELGWDE